MANVELVIKIPEKKYQTIIKHTEEILDESSFIEPKYLYRAVLNGTPLPKGHGRLIDAGVYVDVLNNAQIEGLNTYEGLGRAKELLIETHTIIEADKESEDNSGRD